MLVDQLKNLLDNAWFENKVIFRGVRNGLTYLPHEYYVDTDENVIITLATEGDSDYVRLEAEEKQPALDQLALEEGVVTEARDLSDIQADLKKVKQESEEE